MQITSNWLSDSLCLRCRGLAIWRRGEFSVHCTIYFLHECVIYWGLWLEVWLLYLLSRFHVNGVQNTGTLSHADPSRPSLQGLIAVPGVLPQYFLIVYHNSFKCPPCFLLDIGLPRLFGQPSASATTPWKPKRRKRHGPEKIDLEGTFVGDGPF